MKLKSKACWEPDLKKHDKCRYLQCLCPCHRRKQSKVEEAKGMMKTQFSRTVGEHEVTIDEQGVYHSTPPRPYTPEELQPTTSEAAKAHGLRRIPRKHYYPVEEAKEKK